MPASFEISTGKPIEYHNVSRPGTLIQTAISNGYPNGDVEERDITKSEYNAAVELWEASDADSIAAKELSDQKEVAKQAGLAKLYAQAGLTTEEIEAQ